MQHLHFRSIWVSDTHLGGRNLKKLDKFLAKCLNLNGDLIPDFRLIDYLVTLPSTDTNPALNDVTGNQEQLKQVPAHNSQLD